MDVAAPAAVLGVVLACAGTLAYLRDIRAGRTVPHRGTWLVWSVVATIATVSHAAGGGRWSLAVMSAQGVGCLLVLGWSFRRGVGGMTLANLALVGIAGLGVAGWLTFSDPLAASCGAALADAAGLAGTVPKIWKRPHTETWATYALAGATGMIIVLSAGSTESAVLVFPVYYCVANVLVARLITVRRRCTAGPDTQTPLLWSPDTPGRFILDTSRARSSRRAHPPRCERRLARHGQQLPHVPCICQVSDCWSDARFRAGQDPAPVPR